MNAPAHNVELYCLLGTRPDAAREEIEQAYRAEVARLQPEFEGGNHDALNQLRQLREAYHILTDTERRARYDAWMRPPDGRAAARPAKERGIDGLGWTVIVALVALAVGALLTVFLLLERVEDVRISYAEMVRVKKAEHNQAQKAVIVPLPAEPRRRGQDGRP